MLDFLFVCLLWNGLWSWRSIFIARVILLSPFRIWSPLGINLLLFFWYISVYTFDNADECMIHTSQNRMVNHFWQRAPMVFGMSLTTVIIMPLGIIAYFLDHCVNSLYDIQILELHWHMSLFTLLLGQQGDSFFYYRGFVSKLSAIIIHECETLIYKLSPNFHYSVLSKEYTQSQVHILHFTISLFLN